MHPGPINETDGFSKMCIETSFLKHPLRIGDFYHIKTSCKEDEDFVIIPEKAFKYLDNIYGGIPLPRVSIELG